ncbi:MAG: hypothetical protein ABIS50_23615, partial [Luteolibacter sp.]
MRPSQGFGDRRVGPGKVGILSCGQVGVEIYQSALDLVLRGLRDHGLLKGRHLGIDSSVIEANASLREPVHRNTEEQYRDYVKRLAAAA